MDDLNGVRHIFFDLDGTLIGSSGDVKEAVWQAIDALRDSGLGFSVCTGRPRAGVARRVARRLEPDGLHIFENGGMVAPADGEPANVSALSEDDLMRLIDAANRIDATVEFYTPQGIFVSRLDADCAEHADKIDIEVAQIDLTEIVGEIPVVRAHWIFREPARDDVLAVELYDSEMGVASSPVLPDLLFGSVTRKGTSKGSAAKFVAGQFGFDLADAIGIGDSPGDLALLENVGHAYVVENAPQALRERFPVLGAVDEDGVLALLRALRPA